MNVCIVVTHLLGSGHLARALTLARAYTEAGHNVTVISGGMPVAQLDSAGLSLVQLPPLRSDGVNFSRLLDQTGAQANKGLYQTRRDMLVECLTDIQPEVLITELFPFGRRNLKTEFTTLLDTAQSLSTRPLVCASIRDILAPPSKPAKAAFADDLVAQFYDAVLVHADADVTPLSLSWPVTDRLAQKLFYTGFVAPSPAPPHPQELGRGEIIVSAGGGDVGARLFKTCVAAAKRDPDRQWRLLIGGRDAAQRCAELRIGAPANTLIEPARPEFRQMLHHAAVSISMCGYNTGLDVLQSGVRAVFVPFDEGNEVEQGLRADALALLPSITVLRDAALGVDSLLDAVQQVLRAPPRAARTQGFDGAAATVRVTEDMRKADR